MVQMGCGSKGAPLTWCTTAAAFCRAAQALLHEARKSGQAAGRIHTFLDDPLLNLLGTQDQRDRQSKAVLLRGLHIAWSKRARGEAVSWIGLEFLTKASASRESSGAQLVDADLKMVFDAPP